MSVHIRDPDDVERRMEVGWPNGHRRSFYVPIRGTWCASSATQMFFVSM